jgi:hypothetical protein
MSGPLVRSVVDSQFGNQPAWQVTDATVGGAVPNYNVVLQGPPLSEALNNVWRFQTTARLVDDFGAGPTHGLSVYLNNTVYLLMIDRTTNGQLQAYLFDGASKPLRTHTIASGATAFGYFDYELRYDPGPKLVTLLVNGVVRDTWDGDPTSPHEDLIRWGSGWPNGAGQMNFRQVKFFTAVSPAQSGDFNGDSRVDAADYVVWRDNLGRPFAPADGNGDGTVNAADYLVWRGGFGAQFGAAATTAVPEPTTRLLLLPALAIVGRRNCRLLRS